MARLDLHANTLPPGSASDNLFRKLPGGEWTIRYEGRVLRLRERKGLSYLAHLLAHPGEELHVLELCSSASVPGSSRADDPAGLERARKAVRNRIRDTISTIRARDPELGQHLDRSVRTGTRCSYAPGRTVPWVL